MPAARALDFGDDNRTDAHRRESSKNDTTTKSPAPPANRLLRLLYRPPFVGLLAFLVVFLVQGLGHTQMILMEAVFGDGFVYQSAFLTGLVGAIALVIGMRSSS